MKILKFEASWCGPCEQLSKIIGSLGDLVKIPIDVIDVDDDRHAAIERGVRGVPTLILLNDDGEELKRHVGTMSSADFLEFAKV